MTSNPQQPVITELSQLDPEKVYSYADYWLWRLKERVELIGGKIFKMSPAPRTSHELVSQEINYCLLQNFRKTGCKVFTAPFDVRLQRAGAADNEVFTVVQPDLCVICDRSKIDKRGCLGAPDLVVEVLSPGSLKREMRKFDEYEAAGVKEYWLVDYVQRSVQQFVLQNNKLVGQKPFAEEDCLQSVLFSELRIKLQEVFADIEDEDNYFSSSS